MKDETENCCASPARPYRDVLRTNLFVIRMAGRDLYWNCSAEHGSGWNPGNPKQSFSPSELTREIRRLIDNGTFCNVEILELKA